MQGKIGVLSHPGIGSEFWFTVTLDHGEAPMLQHSLIQEKKFKNQRVLIVEDNIINQKLISEMVRLTGAEFTVVASGEECLQALSLQDYHINFMDCQMPSMDGYETTWMIRTSPSRRNFSIPIIALTADAFSDTKSRCLEVGMNDYLAKPIRYDDIVLAMDKWCSHGSEVLFNTSSVQTLKNIDPGGSLLRDLFQIFETQSKECLKICEEATQLNDLDAIKFNIHKLKSSVFNLGMKKVGNLCQQIEMELEFFGPLEFEPSLRELEKMIDISINDYQGTFMIPLSH